MKNFNGIQTPFDNAIVPIPGGSGVGTTDIGGVSVTGNSMPTAPQGQMPEVSGVTLPDAGSPGLQRPKGMAGS